jgi:arylsulfatase A-like enzyme
MNIPDFPAYEVDPVPTGLPVTRPNLLIFMPDQLRYDSLACFGNTFARTPNIDAFAEASTKFTNCYLQATVCSQSRCSLYTGQYPHISGHRSLENLIKPWEPNMFRSLKESGYHVACLAPRGDTFAPTVTELSVTEYGFLETPDFMPKFAGGGSKDCPEDIWSRLFYKGVRGPEQAVDYDEAAVRSALKWLECPPETPWVLYLPLIFPHCPFQVEEPYFSMYDRAAMPIPVKPSEKTGYEPKYFEANRRRYRTERATDEVWAEIAATYYGMITRLDDQFGRVMDGLRKYDPANKTAVMFYTDHGEYLGDHGVVEKWPSGVSEVLAREPLIIGGAGLPAGKICDDICEMVDLLPTIFQLCGITERFPHNGVSLLPAIIEGKKHPKQYAYTEGGFLTSEEPLLEQAPYPYDIKTVLQHENTELVGKAVGMRSKKWAYAYRLYEPAELYDRENDICELHNLAANPSYADIVKGMQNEMFNWMMETTDVLPFQKDNRFPQVKLETPKEQYSKRLEMQKLQTLVTIEEVEVKTLAS